MILHSSRCTGINITQDNDSNRVHKHLYDKPDYGVSNKKQISSH